MSVVGNYSRGALQGVILELCVVVVKLGIGVGGVVQNHVMSEIL